MTEQKIKNILKESQSKLEFLSGHLSKKQLLKLEQRIEQQQAQLETILGLEKKHIALVEEYSHILDQTYFNQIRLEL